MKPKIIKNRKIQLVGFSFFGNPFSQSSGWTEENEIGQLWQRFMQFWTAHAPYFSDLKVNDNFYELHIEHPSTPETGNYEVYIGVEVKHLKTAPIDTVIKLLPHTNFAVYTFSGSEITSDWENSIYKAPADDPDLKFDTKYHVLVYDRRFKGMNAIEDSEMDVYVPIIDNHS